MKASQYEERCRIGIIIRWREQLWLRRWVACLPGRFVVRCHHRHRFPYPPRTGGAQDVQDSDSSHPVLPGPLPRRYRCGCD